MNITKYLARGLAGVSIVVSFAMCSKSAIKIEETPGLSTTPNLDSTRQPNLATNAVTACTYTVQPSEWFVDGAKIPPGSVICIPAGTRGALLFKNLKGTAAQPIIITNKGGKVTFLTSATASYAVKTQNCQYFKIRGNGTSGIKYGFDVNGGNISMTMDDLSSDFEITNVEVHDSGFAGIMAKTDPSCDVATQRGHFTMRNIVLHTNYVHNTGGEGFYVGNSFYASGSSLACGNVLPHDVVNVKIYDNITEATGCEGIQVGSAIAGCQIYNNIVRSPGVSPFASGQNNGIQIGEGTGGKCYNNMVKDAPGNGIIVLGLGDNVVYNNIIVNSGANGIFADSRFTPGPYFQFINNTIINSVMDGIKLNSELIPMNTVINNVIVGSGSGKAIHIMSSSVKLTSSNNFVSDDPADCGFVNYGAGDYHLLPSSQLINKGLNALPYGITTDYYGKARRNDGAFDIGASEY
jgi:hypothetical protein